MEFRDFSQICMRVSIPAIILLVPYLSLLSVVLIPGWLVRCLREKRIADWYNPIEIIFQSLACLVIGGITVLPVVLLAAVLMTDGGYPLVSGTNIVMQKGSVAMIGSWMIAILLIGIVLILPSMIQIYASKRTIKDALKPRLIVRWISRNDYWIGLAKFGFVSVTGLIVLLLLDLANMMIQMNTWVYQFMQVYIAVIAGSKSVLQLR